MKTQLIGLYSPLPQSGKTTVAQILVEQDWRVVPFAGTLKRMLRVLLLDLGQSEEEAERALSTEKELPCILLNTVTPRQMMQRLGTEWGRQLVAPDVWVRCWKGQVIRALGDGESVVADDIRFPEEAKAVSDLGGLVVRVLRPGGGSSAFAAHASEGALNDWPFDHTIVNDGSLEDLQAQVLELQLTLSQATCYA